MQFDAETLELLKRLQDVNAGRQPAAEEAWNRALAQEDMDYKRQYAEAMRNADREMENPDLMAEYWANERFLDKELKKPSAKNVVSRVGDIERKRLGERLREKLPEGGMTSSANMSRELNPFLTALVPNQSYIQPQQQRAEIKAEGFSEGTNEALRNSLLALGGAGALGMGAYVGKSQLANIGDEINQVINPNVPRSIYNQAIPPVIEQNRLGVVPETKIPLQTKQQLPVDRVNPEQIKYNQLQESLKDTPTRGATFSGKPAEYSNIVGKPQLAKEMESKLAKDYFAKQILRGLAGGAKLMRSEVPAISMEEIDPGNAFQKQLDEKIRQIQLKRLGIID